MKLFLKGSRCDTPKCAYDRRDTPPGMHGTRRSKMTDYGIHLREKQKLKHYYGVLEAQFRVYFSRAAQSKGNTGSSLLSLLERRLDNVIHRMGFASSRSAARQLIVHGHITVNGHRLDRPSFLVKPGDVIRIKNRAKSLQLVQMNMETGGNRPVPDFLSVTTGNQPEGRMVRIPDDQDASLPINTQLIIELCSK